MSVFKKHKITTLISVNIILLLVFLSFIEIGTRIFYPELMPLVYQARKYWEYDSLLGWAHIPNSVGIQMVSSDTIPIQINSKKLRDNEYQYKRNSKKRILVLGDSFAWGFGVKEEDRFSGIIESELENCEIINAAVAGYSTDQQYLYYREEGYKYKPDIVLLLFYDNDFLGNSVDKIYWYNKPKFYINEDSLILTNIPVPHLSLYQQTRRFLSGKSYFLSFLLKRISMINVKSFSNHNFDMTKNGELTGKIFSGLNNKIKEYGGKLVVVTIPMEVEKVTLLKTISEKESFGFVDLSPSFEKETDYIIPEDGHWNLKGHRLTAQSLLEPIRKIMDAR